MLLRGRQSRAGAVLPVLPVLFLLAACGEEADPALPDWPEERLIDESGQPERVIVEPDPTSGTGGVIPGYRPLEEDDALQGDEQQSDRGPGSAGQESIDSESRASGPATATGSERSEP